jgi:streptogramin lyase
MAVMIRPTHTALLGLFALTACTSAPAWRAAGAEHPALAGPAAPETTHPSPFDTTVTYGLDGTRDAVRIAPGQSGRPGQAPAEPETAGYTCPMHPEVRAAEPGKCPICDMTLVPAGNGGAR